jgi:hypothetical protein
LLHFTPWLLGAMMGLCDRRSVSCEVHIFDVWQFAMDD